MSPDEKVRENRLRRMAWRQGYTLSRSRRRDPQAVDYGLYALINPDTGATVHDAIAGRFIHSLTLDDVESFLKGEVPNTAAKRGKQ